MLKVNWCSIAVPRPGHACAHDTASSAKKKAVSSVQLRGWTPSSMHSARATGPAQLTDVALPLETTADHNPSVPYVVCKCVCGGSEEQQG